MKIFDYFYIVATILFTVYGQIILKWRIAKYGVLPQDFLEKIKFLFVVLFDPFVFSGLFAAFLASLAWIAAMTKFDLSYAYPFVSLNFILVVLLSGYFLGESITVQKILGTILIIVGTTVAVR